MKKVICIVLMLLPFFVQAQYSKRLALVIGNSAYQSGGTLKNPVNDARAVASSLQSMGFEVIKVENVNQAQMKQAINQFGQKLKGYEVGLFYYAGHGIQSKGSNYMIPVDAHLSNEEQVEFDCVKADQVLAYMETADAKVNVLILDACRNNPFERSWARSVNGNGLAIMNAPKGSLIAYATSPGRTASDGAESNGLYTSALLKYMRNSKLTIEQVFKQVRNEVNDKSGGAQIPWETTSLTGQDFYFTTTDTPMPDPLLSNNATAKKSIINRNVTVTPENKALADTYVVQAKNEYDKIQDAKAAETFTKAINLNPLLYEAYYWRGNCYYNLKENDKAIDDYNAAIELKSNYAEAFYWRGNAYFYVKQDNLALADYTKAISFKTDYTEAYYMRGRTNFELIKDNDAKSDFDKVISLNPNHTEAHYWRGKVYYEAKNYTTAIADFNKAISLKADHYEAYYWRANAKFSMKTFAEAIQDFNTCLNLKPEYAEAYFYRGKVYYNMAKYKEAIDDYSAAIRIKPQYADAYYFRAIAKYLQADDNGTIADCAKVLEINPNHADALYYKGLAEYNLKMDADALTDLTKSLELKPAADAHYYRGMLKYYAAEYSDAIQDFNQSIKMASPTSTALYNYYYMRGTSYYNLKMDEQNIQDQNKVIELKPDYAKAYYMRSCSKFYTNQIESARTDLNRALELDPKNQLFIDFKNKNFK